MSRSSSRPFPASGTGSARKRLSIPERPPRRPGLSFRLKLTFSYTGLLVLAGLLLFVVLLLVLRYVPDRNLVDVASGDVVPNRGDLMKVAVRLAIWGMAFLVLTGLVAGWVLAGQMLRPLERITRAAHSTARGSLSHRIALPGRDDELGRLADAFDRMLEQLERAFEEQRRFTANVSHELRTPQTVMRTMLQVAQANPGALNLETFLTRLQEMNDRSIDTHEALLQLARLERDDLPHRTCDLAEVTRDVLRRPGAVNGVAARDSLSTTGPVLVEANPPLLRQLVDNLVRNAVLHNLPTGGTVWVDVTSDERGRALLRVANTGAVIPAHVAATLTEPFVRAAGRTRLVPGAGGSGLGLAIVASVARAHRADLSIRPRPEGGLTVTVTFPRTPSPTDETDLPGAIAGDLPEKAAPGAEFEANIGHQRTREGMALAKKNGKLKGKQPKLPEPARRSIRRRYAEGEVSLADLATEYSVGRSTIHRIIHGPAT